MEASTALIAVAFLVIGAVAGYLVRRYWAAKQFGGVEEKIKKDLAEAEVKAKEILVEAKDKAASLLVQANNDEKTRRKEIEALESHLLRKEETLDKKSTEISAQEAKLKSQDEKIKTRETDLEKREGEMQGRIEKIGGLSVNEARETILRQAK